MTSFRQYCFFAACLLLLASWALPSDCNAIDRCKKHIRTVIREAHYFIGLDAPVHYFMGQIDQESRCNEGITAFDGGKGLGQFMPQTAEWLQGREKALQELYREPHPYDPVWSIRALVLYDKWLYKQTACKGWYFAFRAYNGGAGLLNKEIARAKSCNPFLVEQQCNRKVLTLKNGKKLYLCVVNSEYPYLIFTKAKKYELCRFQKTEDGRQM